MINHHQESTGRGHDKQPGKRSIHKSTFCYFGSLPVPPLARTEVPRAPQKEQSLEYNIQPRKISSSKSVIQYRQRLSLTYVYHLRLRATHRFILDNIGQFQRLLGPCLRMDTPGIRQRLLRLIQRLTKLYGPEQPPAEFQQADFWENLRVAIDKRLTQALAEKGGAAAASGHPCYPSGAAQAVAGSGGGGSAAGPDGDRNKALLPVKAVQMVSEIFPPFADSHAASLMELVKMLSRQHFHQVFYGRGDGAAHISTTNRLKVKDY